MLLLYLNYITRKLNSQKFLTETLMIKSRNIIDLDFYLL